MIVLGYMMVLHEHMSHQKVVKNVHHGAIQIQISFVVPLVETYAMSCSFAHYS